MSATSGSKQASPGGRASGMTGGVAAFVKRRVRDLVVLVLGAGAPALLLALMTYNPADPGPNVAIDRPVSNLMGTSGAAVADAVLTWFGLAGFLLVPLLAAWAWRLYRDGGPPRRWWLRLPLAPVALALAGMALALLPTPPSWTLRSDIGGVLGVLGLHNVSAGLGLPAWSVSVAAMAAAVGLGLYALGLRREEWRAIGRGVAWLGSDAGAGVAARLGGLRLPGLPRVPALPALPRVRWPFGRDDDVDMPISNERREPSLMSGTPDSVPPEPDEAPPTAEVSPAKSKNKGKNKAKKACKPEAPSKAGSDDRRKADVDAPPPPLSPARTASAQMHERSPFAGDGEGYRAPPLDLLSPADPSQQNVVSQDALEENARTLESVLSDFGVKGEIVKVRPGPVVTRYDLEPAPGTKTSRVIGLADDVSRSMAAVSVRIAVVPGSSVIGIELPNSRREVVFLRELLAADAFADAKGKLPLILGKDIAGHPQIVDLAKMPHLLVAGTTGSGKSVSVNAMLLSLLYRMSPEQCRMILIDPKMLELSVYEDIPHLLSPVVTDPKKAVVALKWAVREMEERYRKMSRMGVRNIEGYNQRIEKARENGEVLTRKVQTGFDADTGQPIHEEQPLEMEAMPYIVIVVDEMADLMLVAGKEIEMAIQRLAQMARAAGIHVIMATQRPSVDVITGTIKANFPTRISFHVTSKIDSRTILGETGAEQLLGQGDMLYMAHGGKIVRVHGPLVTDDEVESVVGHLRDQGPPDYVDDVTSDDEDNGVADLMPGSNGGNGDGGGDGDLYDKAVAVVLQHKKASTSFVQRQLQIGYNRAARLIERMETEGVVSPANHVGKREILVESQGNRE